MFTQKAGQVNFNINVFEILIYEINNCWYKDVKHFQNEFIFIKELHEYQELHQKLKECDTMHQVLDLLVKEHNRLVYLRVKKLLKPLLLSFHGYTEEGRTIVAQTNVAPLTLCCDRPIDPQIKMFLDKYLSC